MPRVVLLLLLALMPGRPARAATDLADVAPADLPRPVGTGRSQAKITAEEQTLFDHPAIRPGELTHFWAAGSPVVDNVTFRYYIDNETEPSLVFQPNLACGVGFDDQSAPWATKWFGKGAKTTGWFHNFKVPFGSHVRITFALEGAGPTPKSGRFGTIWSIVRGLEGVRTEVAGMTLPAEARLKLLHTDVVLKPLEFVDIVSIPTGQSGLMFATTSQIQSSQNFNFMEGCFHFYDDTRTDWPGLTMSTGMEDYYDSAFYFDGGEFRAPVAGSTHKAQDANGTYWSGYRFHEMDPLVFGDGMRFEWRNGDVTDPATGLKCTLNTPGAGTTCGNPQPSRLVAYAWVYVW